MRYTMNMTTSMAQSRPTTAPPMTAGKENDVLVSSVRKSIIYTQRMRDICHTCRMSDICRCTAVYQSYVIWLIFDDKSYHLLTSQNSGLREEARRAIVLAHDDHFVAVGPVIDALCVGGLAIHVRIGVQFVHVAATCTRCSGEREGIMAMRKRCKVIKKKVHLCPWRASKIKQNREWDRELLFCFVVSCVGYSIKLIRV